LNADLDKEFDDKAILKEKMMHKLEKEALFKAKKKKKKGGKKKKK